jgi:hypothetical protein
LTEKIREYNAAKAGETVKKSHQSLAAVGAEFLAAEDVPGSGGMNSNSAGNGKYFLSLATGPNVDVINKWLAANDSPWMMESGELRAYYTSSADIPYLLKSF